MISDTTPTCRTGSVTYGLLLFTGLLLIAISVLLVATAAASGPEATLTVCTAGPPDCDYQGIQAAVNAAIDGDTIKVAAGTYLDVAAHAAPPGYYGPNIIQQVVFLDKTLTIRGGYTTTNGFADPPDPVANPTTIDAQGQGRGLFIAGTITPVVEGLRFTGGDASGLGGDLFAPQAGGGIYVMTATATLRANQILTNTVGRNGAGGGVCLFRSEALVEGNTFRANTGGLYGGAAYLWQSPATVEGNLITANTVVTYGGGITLLTSSAIVRDNQFLNNTAGYGAGLHLDTGDPTIQGNTFRGNDSIAGGGLFLGYAGWIGTTLIEDNVIEDNSGVIGGGVLLLYAHGQFHRNHILNNSAQDGAGVWIFSSDVRFVGNTFYRNVGTGDGGAMLIGYSYEPYLADNLFTENRARNGGVLYVEGSPGTIVSNTMTLNVATRDGGAVYLLQSDARLENNVIAANKAGRAGCGLHVVGSGPTLVHNTVAGNWGGEGSGISVISTDVVPGAPALTNTILVGHSTGIVVGSGSSASLEGTLWANDTDWAGEGTIITGTINVWGDPAFVDPPAGDYHIGPESAALDQGIDAGLGQDIDGDSRPQGPAPDLGADERLAVDGTLHVDGIRMRTLDVGDGRYLVYGTVRILDDEGGRAPGATVSVLWSLPGGSTEDQQAPTNAQGLARFRLRTAQEGVFELCVTSVSKAGWLYDPEQNAVTCASIVLPQ